jgi:outer membrane protein OmpA-like peptidoglycan-associated protein
MSVAVGFEIQIEEPEMPKRGDRTIRIILKRAVKVDENGADAQKHAGFLNFSERNPGTVRVSTENSKAKVILSRCAVFRPATALFRIILFILTTTGFLACSNPQAGPDKTVAGALLGAGWGAGAGAVVGNQVSTPGNGTAVGSGFGAAAGLLMGMGYDLEEGVQLEQNRQLAALKVQAAANHNSLLKIQNKLDSSLCSDPIGGVYTVFFDEDQTNLRLGAYSGLEAAAEALKKNPKFSRILVAGHTDDTGRPDYNDKLAQARADSVAAYLAGRGIALDQIKIESFSAKKPVATNRTAAGRQLNRRAEISLVE